ncbi:hypothetical protein [Ensifer adhaerens]
MITGSDLLQISLARINMERSELEEAEVIDKGIDGDRAWSNFGRDIDTFIIKLPQSRLAALAAMIQRRANRQR